MSTKRDSKRRARHVQRTTEVKDAPSEPTARSNFLGRLSPTDFQALEAISTLQRYAKGELIFRSGGPGHNVYFLRSGKVKIHQSSPVGREVILWFCFPGEIFGLAEVARGGRRVVNAQACESSEVFAVAQDKFRACIEERPHIALLSMEVLSSRLRVLGDMFVNLVSDDVNTRIAKLIVRLGARYGVRVGSEISLSIPLTHQEIADMVGASRQTVTSALSAFKRQGVLSVENRRIQIESENRLNELARSSA